MASPSRPVAMSAPEPSHATATALPAALTARAEDLDRRHVWHPFTPMSEWAATEPLVITAGDGEFVWDQHGRRYIDGSSSLWCNIHGHRRPEIDAALVAQLQRIAHSTLLGLASEPAARLAARLCELAPPGLTRVFFSDNGATATEIALKMSFQYWLQNGQPNRTEFVTFRSAYHGDTLGAVSVGGVELFHRAFAPLLFPTHLAPSPYCYRCELGLTHPTCALACAERLDTILSQRAGRVAAVIVEPLVQGAGGIITAPEGHLRRLRAITAQHGVHLIADEVAVAFGRTGHLFACQAEGVTPDFLCLAKGLTGGYMPLAATLTTEAVYAGFLGDFTARRTFYHGHTYTGNALGCAAALASLSLFDSEPVLQRVATLADRAAGHLATIAAHPNVGQIRQRGLIMGIELVADPATKQPFDFAARTAAKVCLAARQRGLLIRPLGDVLVAMPPLCISPQSLDAMMTAIAESLAEVLPGLSPPPTTGDFTPSTNL